MAATIRTKSVFGGEKGFVGSNICSDMRRRDYEEREIEIVPVQAYWGSGGIATRILDLGIRLII
jgi:hypothetical protein